MISRLLRGVVLSVVYMGTALLVANVPVRGQSAVINACVNRVNGNVRFVNGPADCRENEDFRQGQPGPQGPAGPAGPQGPKGDTGATGATGTPGAGAMVSDAPQINCPNGGARVADGLGNVAYVCDGATGAAGATGPAGPSGTAGQSAITVLGTGTQLVTSAAPGPFLIPGLTQSVDLPSNSILYVATDGGTQVQNAVVGNVSIVDIVLLVDGAPLNGNWSRRITGIQQSSTTGGLGVANWSIALALPLPAGAHTIEVSCRFVGGSSGAFVGSGSPGVVTRGQLTTIVLRQQ